jgi:NAD(P)-dependent dehydrogenase (short-subunit alcohol dehydrogenase family)
MVHEMVPRGGIAFDKLNDPNAMSTMTRYGQSKLANLLFARALAHRLDNEKVYVNIAHPGYVDSNLANRTGESYGGFVGKLSTITPKVFGMKPKEGALTQLYLATSPEIEDQDVRGRYFIPIAKEIQPCE